MHFLTASSMSSFIPGRRIKLLATAFILHITGCSPCISLSNLFLRPTETITCASHRKRPNVNFGRHGLRYVSTYEFHFFLVRDNVLCFLWCFHLLEGLTWSTNGSSRLGIHHKGGRSVGDEVMIS